MNNFLNETSFPYSPSSSGSRDSGPLPEGVSLSSEGTGSSSGTYRTPQEYIDSLSEDDYNALIEQLEKHPELKELLDLEIVEEN